MQWSKETVLKFLEAYKRQPCIWDPRHYEHKNRTSVAVAWQHVRDSLKFNCSVNELKKKRDSLMASFRMHLNKKKKRMNSSTGGEVVFEPHWFAYETMEKFLGPLYLCRTVTENTSVDETDMYDEDVTSFKIEELSNDDTFTYESNEEIKEKILPQLVSFSSKTSKHQIEAEEETYQIPNDVPRPKRRFSDDEKDECDLYGQLLAKKLRKFSEQHREEIMFEIDGLIIQKRKTLAQQTVNMSKPSVSEVHSPRSTVTSSEYSSMEGCT